MIWAQSYLHMTIYHMSAITHEYYVAQKDLLMSTYHTSIIIHEHYLTYIARVLKSNWHL